MLGAVGFGRAVHGSGEAAIFLDNVSCRGNESRLLDCAANAHEVHNCRHSEDASVVCFPTGNYNVVDKLDTLAASYL